MGSGSMRSSARRWRRCWAAGAGRRRTRSLGRQVGLLLGPQLMRGSLVFNYGSLVMQGPLPCSKRSSAISTQLHLVSPLGSILRACLWLQAPARL